MGDGIQQPISLNGKHNLFKGYISFILQFYVFLVIPSKMLHELRYLKVCLLSSVFVFPSYNGGELTGGERKFHKAPKGFGLISPRYLFPAQCRMEFFRCCPVHRLHCRDLLYACFLQPLQAAEMAQQERAALGTDAGDLLDARGDPLLAA